MLDVVFGESASVVELKELRSALGAMDVSGTLYLGYPVLSTADARIFVDALLVSESHGLVAFDVSSRLTADGFAELSDRQGDIYASIHNKLNEHRELRKGRSLAVAINVVTCHPALERTEKRDDVIACPPAELPDVLGEFDPVEEKYLRPLQAAIQRVSTLRPPRRRENVKKENSRGAVIKRIEREIANLDRWQKRAAVEYADGPQRVRGLAGSGKTVVLALKAAYLHVRHPEWKIAVTFYTRSLHQQFQDLIRRFVFDQIKDEPDWSNLEVLHAWGSANSPGVYSLVCCRYGINPRTWGTASSAYGASRAFAGVCEEVNAAIRERGEKHVFDAALVDEAQDLPAEFFRMVYRATEPPRRIIWAYDDLQNLGDYGMPSERELFGTDGDGKPLVVLKNDPDKPKEDIVLPVCYRNTPWALSTAHALGFGVYRPEGLVQMFKEPSIWPRVGYEVVDGELALGRPAAVRRGASSFPPYFLELLDPEDAVRHRTFRNAGEQYEALAGEIEKDIDDGELEPSDFLVILPDALTFGKIGAAVMRALLQKGITSHLVGVTSSREEVFKPDSVAIAHIHRAKGNEAAMVYVLHAEFCHSGIEMGKKRNTLFTAITRSKCWVRLFGIGPSMEALAAEADGVRDRDFVLQFDYPDREQLEHLARVHRDMTDEERGDLNRKIRNLDEIITAMMQGDLPYESLPLDVRKKLEALSRQETDERRGAV